jgi:SAM-dependent methyltransferase
MAEYLLDNAWRQARERLAALEASLDPGTIRHLDALGVAAGWRCLEVAGGGGSIAAWLGHRVGPRGHVLATDLDPRFLAALAAPNLAVRRHDIVTDDLPAGRFDLVHARSLLLHLPERARALARMVAALRPGGWLLVEEQDFVSRVPDPAAVDAALVARCERAWQQHVRGRGMDPAYGRRLYGEVRARGLVELGSEGRVQMVRGGTPEARVQRLGFTQMRDGLLGTGLVSAAELDRFLALHDEPGAVWLGPITMAVWGRRPAR